MVSRPAAVTSFVKPTTKPTVTAKPVTKPPVTAKPVVTKPTVTKPAVTAKPPVTKPAVTPKPTVTTKPTITSTTKGPQVLPAKVNKTTSGTGTAVGALTGVALNSLLKKTPAQEAAAKAAEQAAAQAAAQQAAAQAAARAAAARTGASGATQMGGVASALKGVTSKAGAGTTQTSQTGTGDFARADRLTDTTDTTGGATGDFARADRLTDTADTTGTTDTTGATGDFARLDREGDVVTDTTGGDVMDTQVIAPGYTIDQAGTILDDTGGVIHTEGPVLDTSNLDTQFDALGNLDDFDNYDFGGNFGADFGSDFGGGFTDYEFKDGGFIDLLYKDGGNVRKMAGGGFIDLGDGTTALDNGNGTYSVYNGETGEFLYDTGEEVQPWQNVDYNYTEDQSSRLPGSYSLYKGSQVYTPTYDMNLPFPDTRVDENGVPIGDFGTLPVGAERTDTLPVVGSERVPQVSMDNLPFPDTRMDENGVPLNQMTQQAGDSNILKSIQDALGGGGVAAGALGALVGNLLSGGGGDSGNQGVDMAELAQMQESGDGSLSVGGGRDAGGVYVPYEQYAYWNPEAQQQLYADLGVSGADQYGDQYAEEEQPEEMPEETQMADGGSAYYTYGKPVSPMDNLGMKKGGLSQAHTMHSHHTNPIVQGRIDFRHGSSVNGAGDGQSDDIPAMLADGEYVIDADTVAQLGNGSNKAGAKILDKFREEIRAHKRSAPVNKIPPKSKSPLAYLKEAMNG